MKWVRLASAMVCGVGIQTTGSGLMAHASVECCSPEVWPHFRPPSIPRISMIATSSSKDDTDQLSTARDYTCRRTEMRCRYSSSHLPLGLLSEEPRLRPPL